MKRKFLVRHFVALALGAVFTSAFALYALPAQSQQILEAMGCSPGGNAPPDSAVSDLNPVVDEGDDNDDQLGDSDSDSDGIFDSIDNCPHYHNPDQIDSDRDGIGDYCDNCPFHHNPGQEDENNDGIGDACDVPPLL